MFTSYFIFQVCVSIYWQYGKRVAKNSNLICSNITKKKHVVTNLLPFTEYDISVSGSTSVGFGNETIIKVRTKEGGKVQDD